MSTELEEKIVSSLVKDRLSCPVALNIAKDLKVNPKQVGDTANKLEKKVANCQLGFFKFEKPSHDELVGTQLNKALAEEIEASLVNDRLACAVAFKIGQNLNVTLKEVGDTANKLNKRIVSCQLGLFP